MGPRKTDNHTAYEELTYKDVTTAYNSRYGRKSDKGEALFSAKDNIRGIKTRAKMDRDEDLGTIDSNVETIYNALKEWVEEGTEA